MPLTIWRSPASRALSLTQHRTGLRRALTLVEVLVVIVVIAMLLCLLIPAMLGTRGTSRGTQCGSNLHNISLAFQQHDSAIKILPDGGESPFLTRALMTVPAEADAATELIGPPWAPPYQTWGWGYQVLPYMDQDAPDKEPLLAPPLSGKERSCGPSCRVQLLLSVSPPLPDDQYAQCEL